MISPLRAIQGIVEEVPFATVSVRLSTKDINGKPWWCVVATVDLHPTINDTLADPNRIDHGVLEVVKTGDTLQQALDQTYLALKEGLGL